MVGMEALRSKLKIKQSRVSVRYRYYDMKQAVNYINKELPTSITWTNAVLGWCGKAVDSMADRLVFREFANDSFGLNQIYQMNNRDILFDSAILAALIGSCSFIYIVQDATGFPRLRVIDAYNATGTLDPVTYMLKEGYAVLERDARGNVLLEAYFVPGETWFYPEGEEPYVVENPAPYPLLVPVIYRPDATRAFGHSRISRACMDLQQAAMRTLKRSDIAAEFYSYPQRYVLGMHPDAERIDKYRAAITTLMQIDKDEDGDKPTVGQFQQQSMAPFMEQIKMLGGLFAGETGLTLDDLGIPLVNPSSVEAIRASHEQLRLSARKAQRSFGAGFLNAGYLAACVRDDFGYLRQQLYQTTPKFEPIFEPDVSQIGTIGDAVYKIQQSFPDYFNEEKLRDLTGI